MERKDIWQFLRFCVVGTSNAVIDFGVLNLLLQVHPTKSTGLVLGYNTLAVVLAATNSFFWNKYWTFAQRARITSQEVSRFIVLASLTTLMNDLLLTLLSLYFPGLMSSTLIGANLLKLGAIVGTMSISFFGMRLWVFFHVERNPYTYRTEWVGKYLVHTSSREEEVKWGRVAKRRKQEYTVSLSSPIRKTKVQLVEF